MALSWDDYFASLRDFSDTHSVDGVAPPCSSFHSTQCSYEETPCVKVFFYNDNPMDIAIVSDLTVESVFDIAFDTGGAEDLIDHGMNHDEFVLFYFQSDLGETVADERSLVQDIPFEYDEPVFFLDEKSWYDFPVKMLGQNIVRNVRVHSLETLGETHEKVAQLYGIEPNDFYLIHRDDVISNLRKSHLAYGFDTNTTTIVKPRGCGGVKTGKPKEPSLVKQLKVKQTKKEEYKQVCADLKTNQSTTTCDVVKTGMSIANHFASIPEDHSYNVILGAINDNAVSAERLNEMFEILDPKNRRYNGAETKLEGITRVILYGQIEKLTAHEKLVQETRKAVILNFMRHCIKLATCGAKMDTKPLKDMIATRIQCLKATVSEEDVKMEGLANLFAKTNI